MVEVSELARRKGRDRSRIDCALGIVGKWRVRRSLADVASHLRGVQGGRDLEKEFAKSSDPATSMFMVGWKRCRCRDSGVIFIKFGSKEPQEYPVHSLSTDRRINSTVLS